jgi:hypothetical protein
MLSCPFEEKYKYLSSIESDGYLSSKDVLIVLPKFSGDPKEPSVLISETYKS